uniref:Uncharacterized protein n=1 Tax=Naja naja TaxID=35670 RepID=A0A8C6Y097_NAJNA
MGSSESFPATPTCTPLLNKHLKNVSDPRSPTAGILRTPIEVESSPKDNTEFPKQGELVAKCQHENWDPRSPTPGISRTPLKDVLAEVQNPKASQCRDRPSGQGWVSTASSVPNFQETVPRASCCSHAICSYSQTAHPIIVSRQKACRFK